MPLDGRENPDTFQTLLDYPKGFLVSYSTSFGNDAPSFIRFMGKKATLMNFGTLPIMPLRRKRANWLDCLRSRKQPNATVLDGYAHSVACIMAARAFWEGRRLYWDRRTESILDHPPQA